jgi:hypothetical protein
MISAGRRSVCEGVLDRSVWNITRMGGGIGDWWGFGWDFDTDSMLHPTVWGSKYAVVENALGYSFRLHRKIPSYNYVLDTIGDNGVAHITE